MTVRTAGAAAQGLTGPFLAHGSSFVEFIRAQAPDLLGAVAAHSAGPSSSAHGEGTPPTATTIVALTYSGGLVMAGDRRATVGTMIASREMEKVFPADWASAIGVAGTAGIAIELVRLFQLELEHYEKIEGASLSLDGKANRLASLLRGNLGLAMRGLAVVPLFGGHDPRTWTGRIFSYDVTGGRYEEREYHAVGSGAVFARGSLKKLWRPGLDAIEAVRVAVAAIIDAADDDAATSGPDVGREIWPTVAKVDAGGYARWEDEVVADAVSEIFAERRAAR